MDNGQLPLNPSFEKGKFNTLAQSETAFLGNGSDISDKKVLKGRAKRKLITQTMALSLVKVAEYKGESEWIKTYWNTYHCQNKVLTSGPRLFGKYCKNRNCTLCCSIRKAAIINTYLPFINTWEDPHFVTLTIKSISARSLVKYIRGVNRGFRKIKNKLRKRHQRGRGSAFMGIKSLECNFNPVQKIYNPHLHLIVPSKETAELLINEWLKLWTPKHTNRKAQHFQKIDNAQRALIETVKYGSKIFTEPDLKKKGELKSNREIYVAALHNIFLAMKGMRIFERFGFNLPKNQRNIEGENIMPSHSNLWEFNLLRTDWINSSTDKSLSEFIPPPQLEYLLHNSINILTE